MSGPVIAVAEGRDLEKLAEMLESGGAEVIRCPMLVMVDPEDTTRLDAFLSELLNGAFDEVVFMTGEGVVRFFAHADRLNSGDALTASLQTIRVIARGFKAVKALKARGITPTGIADPPTSEGIIAYWSVNPPDGLHVGIMLAGDEPATKLENHLAGVASWVTVVSSYTYAPASDSDAVGSLLDRMESGEVQVLALTSIAQARALMNAAAKHGKPLSAALNTTRIASIGPALSQFLAENDIPVAMQPENRHFLAQFARTILATSMT